MPTLHLYRLEERVNALDEMTVFLNGKPVGTLAPGAKLSLGVAQGAHRLQVRMDAQGSKTYRFRLAEGGVHSLGLSSDPDAGKHLDPLASGHLLVDLLLYGLVLAYHFIFVPNRSLKIEPMPSSLA
ncbi:MAG TPA: hypothetical protein VHK69_03095 [Chitinophagaceae bacterium]|jgi:hypothetical protein|nr:hypothetical protein [Chitinophagaceae bacterium]